LKVYFCQTTDHQIQKKYHQKISMDLNQVFEQNQSWVAEKLGKEESYFSEMAKGQSPDILYIGCSDSRVSAELMMGLEPGEAFVHRNIANVISGTDHSAMSVIHYAVAVLQVKHVIVCGHYACGGVKAAMDSTNLPALNGWLRNIRDVYRLHRDELDEIKDEDKKYDRLVELNVHEQCVNTLKTPEIQNALRNNAITVHGWVYDIASGNIKDLGFDTSSMLKELDPIYKID